MKRMMYKKKAQDKENSSDEESEDIDSDTEEEEDPPTYRTRRRQTKIDRFAEQIEDIVQEQHRDRRGHRRRYAKKRPQKRVQAILEQGESFYSSSIAKQSGRTIKPTERLIEQMQARAEVSGIAAADLQYMQQFVREDEDVDQDSDS